MYMGEAVRILIFVGFWNCIKIQLKDSHESKKILSFRFAHKKQTLNAFASLPYIIYSKLKLHNIIFKV